jgi:pimeloyl-ACP methyl ester carboxylesterase
MATFVLVHGAWHGSWCWKRVRNLLQEQGHDVFTPTLTGLADRSHLISRDVNLETHILDVVNLIRWEELSDVVLCGHSYAGAVVTGAADRIPDRIHSLVYLDAFVPEDGENLARYLPAEGVDGWKLPPIPAKQLGVNAADREWVDRQCTVQPLECFHQHIRLEGGIDQIENFTYVCATGSAGENAPFLPYYERAQAKGWRTLTIACGHDVMLDQPEALASLLLEEPAMPRSDG